MTLEYIERLTGKVRARERVYSKPDAHGGSRLLARAGEEMSLQDAYRRGIREDQLEPVGADGEVALARLAQQRMADGSEEAEAALHDDEEGDEAADQPAEPAPEEGSADEFPRHDGGPWWTLSDGSRVQGSREEAEEAEAALHDDEEG